MDKVINREPNRLPQHIIDNFTNWCLQMGIYKMMKDGSIVEAKKYRTYSPEELGRAREVNRAKRVIADRKAQAVIDEANSIVGGAVV